MGKASSSGWKGGVWAPRLYIFPPEDGIQDLDFLATPPTGIALIVILPISADVSLEMVDWLKGVRVDAARNSMEAIFRDEECFGTLGQQPSGSSFLSDGPGDASAGSSTGLPSRFQNEVRADLIAKRFSETSIRARQSKRQFSWRHE